MLVMLLFAGVASPGCNFFGKQVPKVSEAQTPAAILSEVIGRWSYIDVLPAPTNSPESVFQTRYEFNATGAFQLELQDLMGGGITSTASGHYGYTQSDGSLVAVLSTSTNDPTGSLAGTILRMPLPEVQNHTFQYGPSGGGLSWFFAGLVAPSVPLPAGVWKFDGAFGIDVMIIAADRYAVLQLRDDQNEPYLVDAIVSVQLTGQMEILIFSANPEDVTASLSFDSYAASATTLTLSAGGVSHTGNRL